MTENLDKCSNRWPRWKYPYFIMVWYPMWPHWCII